MRNDRPEDRRGDLPRSLAPLLVLAATRFELEELLARTEVKRRREGSIEVARGKLAGIETDLAVTGVGKSHAAFTAGCLLSRGGYRALLNLGVAGAFPGCGLSIGDVVIADREILADEGSFSPEGFLDLEALGLPPFPEEEPFGNEVPLRPPLRLPSSAIAELSRSLGFPVRAGPLCTVSCASGTDRRAAEIRDRWRAIAESLEGGALALAARRFGVPFLEVRGVSNLAGDRRRESWDLPLAAARASRALTRILEAHPLLEGPP